MAGAEIRTVWQRTVNRCFVQEDAKRAPKLACCQAPSPASDHGNKGQTGIADLPDQPGVGSMPSNRNLSHANLPHDKRWWLQLQPGFGYQKGFTTPEQLNALETEVENLIHEDGQDITYNDGSKNSESSLHEDFTAVSEKEDPDMGMQDAVRLYDKNFEKDIQFDTSENGGQLEMDRIGCPRSQKRNACCFDSEFLWSEGEKNVPWWHVTDKDDLASLVAQKSLDHIENCDLPPPQKINIKRYPCAQPDSSSQDDILPSSFDWNAQQGYMCSPSVAAQGGITPESKLGEDVASFEGNMQNGSGNPTSFECPYAPAFKKSGDAVEVSEIDPSKTQLLEALRHSQTRAREAEKAAKQACNEKDDIIKLLFRQASQLFAYKQWFRLLQLETLYYQMKNVEQPMSILFPVILPWMPHEGRKVQNDWQKYLNIKKPHGGQSGSDIAKCAVAFAWGLSLVGAGLLLGWTVGWMLPL